MMNGFMCTQTGAGLSKAKKPLPPDITLHEGLVYSRADEDLKMDLYLPRRASEPVPCVIVIQGGGFKAQDGKRFRPFAVYLAENGFAAALIAYRGQPDHTYPDTIADIKAAVRYVRKISGEYNLDAGRIGAMGRSAGATLVALLAVTGGMEEFEGEGGHSEFSSRIQAGVGYAGVYDFVARFTDEQQISMQPGAAAKIKSNGQWIGEPFLPGDGHWQRASAINYVDKTDVPMLLVHCEDDSVVPWPQSQDMYMKLKKAGVHTEIEYYETGGHGFRLKESKAPMARMVAFFRKTLTKQPAAEDNENATTKP